MKGRHLWNPSNFGISMMLLLAPQAVATLGIQWGNSLWPMVIVWTLGAIIVWRLQRLHICATYVASFFVFAALRSALSGQPLAAEIAPITGPMYQLFIFFMITDPKSTVLTRRGQVAVVVCVALMESASCASLHNVHAPYYALFLVGPAANAPGDLAQLPRAGRPGRPARRKPLRSHEYPPKVRTARCAVSAKSAPAPKLGPARLPPAAGPDGNRASGGARRGLLVMASVRPARRGPPSAGPGGRRRPAAASG